MVESRVGLVDLAPTLLQELGIAPPATMQGASLVTLMKMNPGGPQATAKTVVNSVSDRPQYAETDYPRRAFGWSSLRAWRAGKYLYIDAPKRELYDQVADPNAAHNLVNSAPTVADTHGGPTRGVPAQDRACRHSTSRYYAGAGCAIAVTGLCDFPSGQPEAEEKQRGPDPKKGSKSQICCTKHCSKRMRNTTATPFRAWNKC